MPDSPGRKFYNIEQNTPSFVVPVGQLSLALSSIATGAEVIKEVMTMTPTQMGPESISEVMSATVV